MPRLRRTVEGTSPNTVDNQEQVLRRQEVEAVDTEQPMRPVEVDALQRRRGRPRKSEQPTAGETLQPETPKRKRGRPKKNPLPEPEMEAPEQEEALLEPTVGEQGSVAVEESTVVAEQPSVATEESELPVSEQLSFPVGEPTQEVEAAPEQPPAEELTPEAETSAEPEPVVTEEPAIAEENMPETENLVPEGEAALSEQPAEEPVTEPEAAVEESLSIAEDAASEAETSAEPEPVVMEQPAIAEEPTPETENLVPEVEAALSEQPAEEPVTETEAAVEESLPIAEEPASEAEEIVAAPEEDSSETVAVSELTETEAPSEPLPADSAEAVEPPAEEVPSVEQEPASEEETTTPEEPVVTQEAAPAEDQGEVTLKYDMDSGKRYVDEISLKTNFEKVLEELAKISKDMLSWEVEKFTDRFTKKYVGEGMTLEEANSKKFEAFLGGFITNAAMELYDRGYKDAAFHKLEQAVSVLEARRKLDYEVDSIKARQDEDVVDLSDMLGLFDGD